MSTVPSLHDKTEAQVTSTSEQDGESPQHDNRVPVPLSMKILSVVVVSMIGFGGHWSSGVTGALKSTLKQVGQTSGRSHVVVYSLTTSCRK